MFWKQLALVPLGVVMGLLMMEGGLQIGGFFMKRSKRSELPVAWVTGNLRVLCLGDSNTYGVWLEREESYPQQLEALWNERIAVPKLEVLNLGFPGTNSSRLVRDLPRLLETFDPDILILMVGVNDFWTLPFLPDAVAEKGPKESFLARHSLVYRLYLSRRGHVADKIQIIMDPKASLKEGGHHKARVGDLEFDMGFATAGPGQSAGDGVALKKNLHRLVEQARAAGTSLYLMTYPSRRNLHTPASRVIAAVSRETGTPLIDLRAIFEPICPEVDCPDVLFADGHPKASGYAIVAEAILKRLEGNTPP